MSSDRGGSFPSCLSLDDALGWVRRQSGKWGRKTSLSSMSRDGFCVDNAPSDVQVNILFTETIMTISGVSSSVNAYPSTNEQNTKSVRPGHDFHAEKLLKPQDPRPEVLLKPQDPRPEILLKPQLSGPASDGSQDSSVGKAVNIKA
jgi:hypothetical protein